MSRHPTVKWAQRSDKVYITIELPDANDVKLALEPDGKFSFSATSAGTKIPYEINIDLFDKVDVAESKANVSSRHICYLIKKAEKKWWSRLLKQQGKPPVFLKVDWDKWVDEDEEQENKFGDDMDFGDDMNFSNLYLGGGPEDFDVDVDDDKDEDESDTEDEKPTMEEVKLEETLMKPWIKTSVSNEILGSLKTEILAELFRIISGYIAKFCQIDYNKIRNFVQNFGRNFRFFNPCMKPTAEEEKLEETPLTTNDSDMKA